MFIEVPRLFFCVGMSGMGLYRTLRIGWRFLIGFAVGKGKKLCILFSVLRKNFR